MAATEAASLGYAISVGECNIGIRNNNAAFASQIVSLWDYSTPVMIVSKGPHWESSHNLWTTSIWRAMWSKPLSLNPIKRWGILLLREGVGLSDAGERCVWIGSKYKYQVQRLLRNDPRNVNMSSRCPNGLQFPEIPILLSFHETYWNKFWPTWSMDTGRQSEDVVSCPAPEHFQWVLWVQYVARCDLHGSDLFRHINLGVFQNHRLRTLLRSYIPSRTSRPKAATVTEHFTFVVL